MDAKMAATSKCRKMYDLFIQLFPQFSDNVRLYGPMDRASIKIDTKDHLVLVFTYINDKNWGLQTFKNYADSMKDKK